MATNNTFVISAELKELTEKQVNKFVKALSKSISTAFSREGAEIDAGKFKFKNLDTLAKRAANSFEKSFNTALKDIEINPKKIKSFVVPLTLDLTKAKQQLDEFAKTQKLTLSTVLAPGNAATAGTTSTGSAKTTASALDQKAIDSATKALDAHRASLRAVGLDTKEVAKETNQYSAAIRRAQGALDQSIAVQKVNGELTEKETNRLRIHRQRIDDLTKSIQQLGTAQAKTSTETRRMESFMDSFGFKIGILGFGFGILGGHLQRFSQAVIQLGITGATAIEPLERLHNALAQSSRTVKEQETVFKEINRLADLPGANLERVVQSFRSLASLKLGDDTSLAFIEGLTKVTAISGSGAEGLGRLIDQFRQFELSGVLTKRDVRTIVEQGGGPIASALQNAFGTTDSASLQKLGAEKVIKGLVEELKKIPAPLETATDKFNKLTNAFTRLQLSLAPLVEPGLDSLVEIVKQLEPIATSLGAAFKNLEPSTKKTISTLIVFAPILAGVAAGFLTLLSAVGIFAATLNQVFGVVKTVRPELYGLIKTLGVTGAAKAGAAGLFAGMAENLAKVKSLLPSVTGLLTKLFAPVLAIAGVTVETTSALGSIVKFIPKLLGFAGPLGIIINTVIALVTNAGHVREVLADAFGVLTQELEKLNVVFTEMTGGFSLWDGLSTVFKVISETIGVIVGLVGGFVVDILALIIRRLASVANLVTTVLKMIQDPSWTNLSAFFDSLYQFFVGIVVDFGKLLGATVLDVIGQALQKFSATKGFGDDLVKMAADTRKTLKPAWDGVAKSTEKSADSVRTMREQVEEATKETKKLLKTFEDINTERIRQDTALLRTRERLANQARRQAAETQLDKDIQANPSAALPTIAPTIRGVAKTSSDELASGTVDSLRGKIPELNGLYAELNLHIRDFNKVLAGPYDRPEDIARRFKALADALNAVQNMLKNDTKDLTVFRKIQDEVIKQITVFAEKRFATMPADLRKEFSDTFTKITSLVSTYGDEIAKLANEQEKLNGQTTADIQKKEEEARQLAAQNKALKDNVGLKEQIAAIDRQIQQLQIQATTASTYEKQAAFQKQITELEKQKVDLEKQYGVALQTNANQTEEIQRDQAAGLQKTDIVQRSILATLQLQLEKNNELRASYESGFSEADKFYNNLLKIDDARAKLGQRPLSTTSDFLRGKRLEADIEPLQQQTADLKTAGLPPVEGLFGRFVNDLTRGVPLVKEFRDALEAIAKNSTQQIAERTTALFAVEQAIIKANQELALTKEGSKERKDAELALKYQLDRQKGLVEAVTVHANRLKSVNAISQANVELINDQLRIQLQLNDAEQVNLQRKLDLLELEQELNDIRLQNQSSGRTAGTSLGGAIAGIEAEDRRRVQQLETEYELRRKLVQARLAEAQAALQRGDLDPEEAARKIADLKAELELLRQIKNEQVAGAETPFLDKLIDGFTRFGAAAQSAREKLSDFLNTAASGDLALNVLYEGLVNGVSATDIVGAAFATMASVISEALIRSIRDGENFLDAISSMIGGILIKIGEMLIQMAAMSVIMAFMWGLLNGGIFTALAEAAAAAPFAAIAGAIGAGLIIAGVAMGGNGKATASKNTANSADATTGAQRETFEPNKDPRLVFQKSQQATIQLEIKTDDSQIIKAVINGVNQNGRLTRLIGNRKLEFTV